jgi:hypothetical protein
MPSQTISHSNGIISLPNKLVYKMSYPIKGQSQEGLLLSRVFNQFGIADTLGFHSCGPKEPHGSTEPFFKGAIFWSIFKDKHQKHEEADEHLGEHSYPKPEERGLQCIALTGGGQSLLDLGNKDGGIPSPGELLETILHAIIGK